MDGADAERVADDVRALVADLLPVLAPHAMLDPDSGMLILPVGTAHADISLDALTRACASLPQAAWPSLVETWLAGKTAQVTAALSERGRLRVQLTPRLPKRERRRLVCTPYGDLLDAVVLLDGHRLTRQDAERLAVPDLGGSALEATLARELPALSVRDDGRVRVISGPYATSFLLAPDRFLPGSTAYGTLVALPRYSEVMLRAVQPGTFRDMALELAERARRSQAGATDPCDGCLLWYADEALHRVRFSPLTGRPVMPPAMRRLTR